MKALEPVSNQVGWFWSFEPSTHLWSRWNPATMNCYPSRHGSCLNWVTRWFVTTMICWSQFIPFQGVWKISRVPRRHKIGNINLGNWRSLQHRNNFGLVVGIWRCFAKTSRANINAVKLPTSNFRAWQILNKYIYNIIIIIISFNLLDYLDCS